MKKIILLIVLVGFMSSCITTTYQTKHQINVIRKFNRKKHGKFVPVRKMGDINDRTVIKETRKNLRQEIRRQRHER
jgi:protein-arginine kinase activator protein McsA